MTWHRRTFAGLTCLALVSIDLSGGSSSDARQDIAEAMSRAGWEVDPEPAFGDPKTWITARRDDYRADVVTSPQKPVFLVKVYGVCVPVTAEERDALRQVGSEPLKPGA